MDFMCRRRWLNVLGLTGVGIVVLVSGCSRRQPLSFTASERVQGLPASHQAEVMASLARFFGTPENPRQMIPAEGADLESEDVELVSAVDEKHLRRGAEAYNARCAGCHGVTGDGQGAAAEYLQPKPRDYRRGVFKFTSTPFGVKPTRFDLVRTVRYGAKGTSMPAFPWMTNEDLDAVVDYVIALSQRGEVEEQVAQIAEFDYAEDEQIAPGEFTDALDNVRSSWEMADQQVVQPSTARPPYDAASIAAGRRAFLTDNCWKCHGKDGKGQTDWLSHEFISEQEALPADQRIEINRDAWGEVAPAADITARMLHGGRRPIDIYRRIHTGINGTPMPAFSATFAEDPDKIWHLVHYVLSIVEGGAAELADEVDPTQPTDPPAESSQPDQPDEADQPALVPAESAEL